MGIIEDLERTRQQTLAYFELTEEQLDKTYAPGKWTVRQLLHHITDADTVLYDRVRRAISNPNQVIWVFDQDRWAEGLDYPNFPLAINKAIYTATREAVIYLAKQHYERAEDKQFVHSATGLRSLKDEFDKIAWHNQGHLDQIAKALAKG